MTATKLENLLMGPDAAHTQVFSGGACNAITADGKLGRNGTRDGLNAWLDKQGLQFFDPQIHPDTHGRDYDYDIDGPAEQAARAAAQVTLYEIGDGTQGAVTGMEAVRDGLTGKKVVIWLSGSADNRGRPTFVPAGNPQSDDKVVTGHLTEYVKNGTNVRKSLVAFVTDLPNVIVVKSEADAIAAIEQLLNN